MLAKANNLSVTMLVDSGASVSILRKDVFDSLPSSSRPSIEPVRMNLLTATGQASAFIGKIMLDIRLKNHIFTHEFLLANIKDEAILGMDFFMKHNVDLLFSKSCMKIKGDFIPCFTNRGDPKCCQISVAETVEIPPQSEKIIKGQPCGVIKYDFIGMIESNKSFVEKTGLIIANAVVQQYSNVVPIRVANFGMKAKTVYKNTIAANFEPAIV